MFIDHGRHIVHYQILHSVDTITNKTDNRVSTETNLVIQRCQVKILSDANAFLFNDLSRC